MWWSRDALLAKDWVARSRITERNWNVQSRTGTGQLATAILAALEGGLLLAQIERSTRPLAAALDVMISLTESLTPPAQPPDDPAS
jgi:hypothetical protein